MTTSDDRLVLSSISGSGDGNPLGLILNQLIVITMLLRQIAGSTDEDVAILEGPIVNYTNPTNPTSNAVNP